MLNQVIPLVRKGMEMKDNKAMNRLEITIRTVCVFQPKIPHQDVMVCHYNIKGKEILYFQGLQESIILEKILKKSMLMNLTSILPSHPVIMGNRSIGGGFQTSLSKDDLVKAILTKSIPIGNPSTGWKIELATNSNLLFEADLTAYVVCVDMNFQ